MQLPTSANLCAKVVNTFLFFNWHNIPNQKEKNVNIFEINKTKLWPAFDKFMRLGGHTKVGAGTYKRGEKVYRFDNNGNMNSNLYGRWKVFLHKYLEGGIEYIESMS